MSLRSGNILVYFDLADTQKLRTQAQNSTSEINRII